MLYLYGLGEFREFLSSNPFDSGFSLSDTSS